MSGIARADPDIAEIVPQGIDKEKKRAKRLEREHVSVLVAGKKADAQNRGEQKKKCCQDERARNGVRTSRKRCHDFKGDCRSNHNVGI